MSWNSTLLLGYHHYIGVNNKPVQNSQWYRLIQARSGSAWPILYPTSLNKSPQRLTKFICAFRKCHVSAAIFEKFLWSRHYWLLLTRKCFRWIHLWTSCSLSYRRNNKQVAEEIHSFSSFNLSKHKINWKQHTTIIELS